MTDPAGEPAALDAVCAPAQAGALGASDRAPRVSVIVATYDNNVCLAAALRSVRAQEFRDFEVVVVGDACTDDTGRVVAELHDERFRWLNRARNSGSQSAPNNDGIAVSRGRYIAYLGHDDLWFPWHLSELVGAIERRGADLVHSLLALLLPGDVAVAVGPPGSGNTYATHHVPPSGWLHRRELVDAHGPWPSPWHLRTGVDEAWLSRIHQAGGRIDFHRRLSVLKFPSAPWRAYDAAAPRPQPELLEQIRRDPLACELDVLTRIAAESARTRTTLPPASRALATAARQIGWHLARGYGVDRWPLRPLLQARFQRRYRSALRRQRGLPPIVVRDGEIER
jgi:hypothetical protein